MPLKYLTDSFRLLFVYPFRLVYQPACLSALREAAVFLVSDESADTPSSKSSKSTVSGLYRRTLEAGVQGFISGAEFHVAV